MSYVLSDKQKKDLMVQLKKIKGLKQKIENEEIDYKQMIPMLSSSKYMSLSTSVIDKTYQLDKDSTGTYLLTVEKRKMPIPSNFIPLLEFASVYGSTAPPTDRRVKNMIKSLEKFLRSLLDWNKKGKTMIKEIDKILEGADAFYDDLREMVKSLGDEYNEDVLELLFLLPDLFIYIIRLLTVEYIHDKHKVKLVFAIIYIVSPIDIIPEALIGPLGFTEDILVALNVISESLKESVVPRDKLIELWPGRIETLDKFDDYYSLASDLIGKDLVKFVMDHFDKIRKKDEANKVS